MSIGGIPRKRVFSLKYMQLHCLYSTYNNFCRTNAKNCKSSAMYTPIMTESDKSDFFHYQTSIRISDAISHTDDICLIGYIFFFSILCSMLLFSRRGRCCCFSTMWCRTGYDLHCDRTTNEKYCCGDFKLL